MNISGVKAKAEFLELVVDVLLNFLSFQNVVAFKALCFVNSTVQNLPAKASKLN